MLNRPQCNSHGDFESCSLPAAVPGRSASRRRGISVFWLVLWMPVLLIMMAVVINIANLWLARVELSNALEAAALAAAKEWGPGGSTAVPRDVGVAYASFNAVRCQPLQIDGNLHPTPSGSNPNANLTCEIGKSPPSGNLIFGAITDTDPLNPVTFNAGIAGACIPAEVLIDVYNEDGGVGIDPRKFGIFYDDGPAYLSIVSVSMTLPDLNPAPYFSADTGNDPQVSIDTVPADILNRNNGGPQPKDVRGLDYDPTVDAATDEWTCPNPNGDICFTFSDPLTGPAGRFRTFTINFTDNTFNTTGDPATTDFVRFGAAHNRLNGGPNNNNDGDAFGILNIPVFVVFYNSNTGTYIGASGVFVNIDKDGDGDFNDGWSQALISGTAGGTPAVWARATVPVNSLWCNICGLNFGPHYVSACATAIYECGTGRPRLIRADKYICPGP